MEPNFASHESYDHLIVFEFFLPLRNEGELRRNLDALFFRETLMDRIQKVPLSRLHALIDPLPAETELLYFNRIIEWVSTKFTGYSITHDSGRFKNGALNTFPGAAEIMRQGGSYLIDETTAIVRFIFPIGVPKIKPIYFDYRQNPTEISTLGSDDVDAESPITIKNIQHEATLIRFFFNLLFVENVIQLVNGENEIWMLESGMRTRLHVWKVTKSLDKECSK